MRLVIARPPWASLLARRMISSGSFLQHVDARILGPGQVGGGFDNLAKEQVRLAGLGDGPADVDQGTQFFVAAAQLFDVHAQFVDVLAFAGRDRGLAKGVQQGLDDVVGFAGLEEEIFDAEAEQIAREFGVDPAGHDDRRCGFALFAPLAQAGDLQALHLSQLDREHIRRGRIRPGDLGREPPREQDFAHKPLAGFRHVREDEHPRKGLTDVSGFGWCKQPCGIPTLPNGMRPSNRPLKNTEVRLYYRKEYRIFAQLNRSNGGTRAKIGMLLFKMPTKSAGADCRPKPPEEADRWWRGTNGSGLSG